MKIEATGRGEILLSLDIEEARKLERKGELFLSSEELTGLSLARIREDELEQDMEAQMAEERRLFTTILQRHPTDFRACPRCGAERGAPCLGVQDTVHVERLW